MKYLQQFIDRYDAGRQLAEMLKKYAGRSNVLVLGLPRGGVPVAYEVASALGAPLDTIIVRKLGVPGDKELAMGAIASGGILVLNNEVIHSLGITSEMVERVAAEEQRELERRELAYREGRPPFDAKGRIVLLIDDGIATGATIRAAARGLRTCSPAKIIIAAPIASAIAVRQLKDEVDKVDEVVALMMPRSFFSIGELYEDFSEVNDEEVRELLHTPIVIAG
jgi:predicted phosphoribosyltransferase